MRRSIGVLCEQIAECFFSAECPRAHEPLDIDRTIVEEFNLPPFSGNGDLDHDRIITNMIE